MSEEIKQKEFEKFMQEFMYELKTHNSYYVLENMMKDFLSQALQKRDEETFSNIVETRQKVMDRLAEQHPGISHLVVLEYFQELLSTLTTK